MHNENKVFSPKNMNKLEHPDRYKELPPIEILEKLSLTNGDKFGDFGCGIGFFSIPAAKIVGGSGHVYASDISRDMLEGLKERLPEENKSQVSLCLASVDQGKLSSGLSGARVNKAMISTVLHEVDDPQAFLQMVGGALVSGGKLGVIEWIKKDMPMGPSQAIRISEKELEDMLRKTGYQVETAIQLSKRFYMVIAERL